MLSQLPVVCCQLYTSILRAGGINNNAHHVLVCYVFIKQAEAVSHLAAYVEAAEPAQLADHAIAIQEVFPLKVGDVGCALHIKSSVLNVAQGTVSCLGP